MVIKASVWFGLGREGGDGKALSRAPGDEFLSKVRVRGLAPSP